MGQTNAFQSITVLTHDTASAVPLDLIQAAFSITSDYLEPNQQGLVLKYDPQTQYWVPIKQDNTRAQDSLNPQSGG